MFRRLFTVDGSEDGLINLRLHRHTDAEVIADPGLEQDKRIGIVARESLMDHAPISSNTGLRGSYVDFARGYTVAPQVWRNRRESRDVPAVNDSYPYLPGKNPIIARGDE